MLAQIWKLQKTFASNPRTIARIANFQHREKRIPGIPTKRVSLGCLVLACARVSASISTMKS